MDDPRVTATLADIEALGRRADELTTNELSELSTFLEGELGELAEARDVVGARTVAAALQAVGAERRAREAEKAAEEAELQAIVAAHLPGVRPPEPKVSRGPVSVRDLSRLRERSPQRPIIVNEPRALTASGQPVNNATDLASILRDALSRARPGGNRVPVATFKADFHSDQTLTRDTEANGFILDEMRQGLVASGGLCAPTQPLYNVFGIRSADRPVRAALPNLPADRGGVTFTRPPALTDLSAGIRITTVTQDEGGQTKPVVSMSCDDPVEILVDAISLRLQYGTFNYKFRSEFVTAWLETGLSQWSRVAEESMLATIDAGSSILSTSQTLGAARDVLTAVDQAAAGIRIRNRLPDGYPMTCIMPAWIKAMFRSDVVRQAPGDDVFAVADPIINSWFAARGVNVAWHLDEDEDWAAQAGSPELINYPDQVRWRIFPAGSWVVLDGGELRFDVVADSTLLATNTLETFIEGFEQVAHIDSGESYTIDSPVCADGSAAELIPTSCAIGS